MEKRRCAIFAVVAMLSWSVTFSQAMKSQQQMLGPGESIRNARGPMLRPGESIRNIRRPNAQEKKCEGFCSDGKTLGIFSWIGGFIREPRTFPCITTSDEYVDRDDDENKLVCVNGHGHHDQKTSLECCADTCKDGEIPKIRAGAFGTVHKAIAERPSQHWFGSPSAVEVALKSFNEKTHVICIPPGNFHHRRMEYEGYEKCINDDLISSASALNNPQILRHVTPFFSTVMHGNEEYLAFEFMNGGDLFDVFGKAVDCRRKRKYGEPCSNKNLEAYNYERTCASEWMRQIVEGIEDLVELGFVHRDIKLENILVKKRDDAESICDWELFLADFGGAVKVKDTEKNHNMASIDSAEREVMMELHTVFKARPRGDTDFSPRPNIGGRQWFYAATTTTAPPNRLTYFPVWFNDLWAFGSILHIALTYNVFEGCPSEVVDLIEGIKAMVIPNACTFKRIKDHKDGEWLCEKTTIYTDDMRGDHSGKFNFNALYQLIKQLEGKCKVDDSKTEQDEVPVSAPQTDDSTCTDCSNMVHVDTCSQADKFVSSV